LYVEDLKRSTNKDIEPKDIFEMSSGLAVHPPPVSQPAKKEMAL
jgi:hypothetical protein